MSHDHSQNHYGPNASFDGYDSDLAAAGILIESLRQQLSAAIAACKQKDEALSLPCDRWNKTQFQIARKALAIQPDDSALKTWLGKPTDWKFTTSSGTHYTDDKRDWLDGYGIESVTPLYSPKELK